MKIVNPVRLTPLRIFPEVEQPESPFIIRFRDGGMCALFECDGGLWQTKAVANIAVWLRSKIVDEDVLKKVTIIA